MRVGHETPYLEFRYLRPTYRNHHFSLYHVIVKPTKIIKDLCKGIMFLNAIYTLDLQRSLIILLGLTMTWYSEKNIISYRFIRGFMPNSHKKS